MEKINPVNAYYIKLGTGGYREKTCIESESTIWINYPEIPRKLFEAGKWVAVRDLFVQNGVDPGAATRHKNQVQIFCESGEDTLWITFYKNRLWWCFAQPEVHYSPEGAKSRKTVNGWHSTNIDNDPLEMGQLSGQLLTVQGFRGTLCAVKSFGYLVRKINNETSPEEQAALDARENLVQSLIAIIQHLPWKEFELLTDLIFRQAGWQRLSQLGKTQKTLDLDLMSPISQERYLIQIKSQASRKQFEKFSFETKEIEEFTRYYMIVHTPQPKLTKDLETDTHKLWLPKDIAELVVQYGLTDWVISKAV